jgi:hypothetical protein
MPTPDYDPGPDPRAADMLRTAMLGAGYSPSPQTASQSDAFDPKEFAAYKSARQSPADDITWDSAEQWPGTRVSPAPRHDDDITWDSPAQQWPGTRVSSDPDSMSWSDVGLQALKNTPSSAVQFGHDIAQPFLHPIDTLANIGDVGHGVAQKLGLDSGHEDEPAADAVGHYFRGRYGSLEGFKHALATDPVGIAGDLSMLLTGGESALARVPGFAGKVGEVAGATGRIIDPLNAVLPAGKIAGKAGAEALGLTTGAGSQAIKLAANAGYEGGAAGKAFRENLTGAAPMAEAVEDARSAVSQMRKERGDAYRQAMTNIGMDQKVLNFDKIDDAMRQAGGVKTFKGQDISPSTQGIRHQLADVIDDWRGLDPAEFHTAEGLDALKQKLGSIRDATQYGTPERVVADRAYQGVRRTIIDQAPDYATTMQGYERASDLIKEMEKTLSINPKASVDTTLRKLQSTLRDNVNTSFGRRAELANYLANSGAPHLLEKLAGQALSSWAPRGLNRMLATGAMESVPMMVGLGAGGAHGAAFAGLGALPTMSPRLMGEAAYGAGRAAKLATPLSVLPRPARQVGRLPNSGNSFDPQDYAAFLRRATVGE